MGFVGKRNKLAETVYLITVYPKKAKDNLSKKERDEIKKQEQIILQELQAGFLV